MVAIFLNKCFLRMAALHFRDFIRSWDRLFYRPQCWRRRVGLVNIAYPLSALLQAAGTGIGMGSGGLYFRLPWRWRYTRRTRTSGRGVLLLVAAGVLLAVSFFFHSARRRSLLLARAVKCSNRRSFISV